MDREFSQNFINSLRSARRSTESEDDNIVIVPFTQSKKWVNSRGYTMAGGPANEGGIYIDKNTGDILGMKLGMKSYNSEGAVAKLRELYNEKDESGERIPLVFHRNYSSNSTNAETPENTDELLKGYKEVDVENPNYKNFWSRYDSGKHYGGIMELGQFLGALVNSIFNGDSKTVKKKVPTGDVQKYYSTDDKASFNNRLKSYMQHPENYGGM